MTLSPWIEELLGWADRLPAGRDEPRPWARCLAELDELAEALGKGDAIAAAMEAMDVTYYLALAAHAGVITPGGAEIGRQIVAALVGLTTDELMVVARAKLGLRARPGNPKDDEAERRAVAAALGFVPVGRGPVMVRSGEPLRTNLGGGDGAQGG